MLPRPIRALLVDLDGTVFVGSELIPGAAEAIARLRERGIAVAFATNTTTRPRSTLAAEISAMGLAVRPEEILNPLVAARALLTKQGLVRCHLLVKDAAREDMAGIAHVDEAPRAVVVGDVEEEFRWERLNAAFRHLLAGAELVALARNRYYRKPEGLVLDLGPFVAALEYASGKSAIVVGKPSPEFFLLALAPLGVPPEEAAAVGDDLEGDVAGAQAAGMRGFLVKTGKFREGDLEASRVVPDAVLPSLAAIEDLL